MSGTPTSQSGEKARLESLVEAVLTRMSTSETSDIAPNNSPEVAEGPVIPTATGGLVSQQDVLDARNIGSLRIPEGTIITPLARDTADRYSVNLVSITATSGSASLSTAAARRIAIGSDHGGFDLKEALKGHLKSLGYNVEDQGTLSATSCDYPDYALKVAAAVARGDCSRGICVDGFGIGSGMTANKVPGILAAVCWDAPSINNSRAHNDANVLCVGSQTMALDVAKTLVQQWLETPFEGGRHARRTDKIRRTERAFARQVQS